MRRIVTVILSTLTLVVLLFSYRTSTDSTLAAGGTVLQQTPATTNGSSPNQSSAPPDPSSNAASTGSSASTPKKSSGGTTSYTGGVAQTRWGPVQVKITVTGGKITAAAAVQYPQGNGRDFEINSYALPVLEQEAVQQQSAQIDTVSGATVTSDGYLESLQAAIDAAHL